MSMEEKTVAAKSYTLTAPQTVRFGVGCVGTLGDEARRLGASKVLFVTDAGVYNAGLVEPLVEQLIKAGLLVEIFAESEPEPTYPSLNSTAALLSGRSFDLIVGVGGGSSLDTAKGLSVLLAHGGRGQDYVGIDNVPGPIIKMILIPTTAGTGSEVTNIAIFGDPDKELKMGIVSPHLVASVALVDPALTYSCPRALTAASGVDALVHAIESFTSLKACAYTDALALTAMKLIVDNLEVAVLDGQDKVARHHIAEGSLLAGIAFGNAGVAAVHALAYPLGARFHVPHGLANGVLLPHVLRHNLPANYLKYARVARAISEQAHGMPTEEAARHGLEVITELCRNIGIPVNLRDLGVPEQALDGLATATMSVTRLLNNNPKQLSLADVREIWRGAW